MQSCRVKDVDNTSRSLKVYWIINLILFGDVASTFVYSKFDTHKSSAEFDKYQANSSKSSIAQYDDRDIHSKGDTLIIIYVMIMMMHAGKTIRSSFV